jgi:hypothetical protein
MSGASLANTGRSTWELGLAPLVESHTGEEVERAVVALGRSAHLFA